MGTCVLTSPYFDKFMTHVDHVVGVVSALSMEDVLVSCLNCFVGIYAYVFCDAMLLGRLWSGFEMVCC